MCGGIIVYTYITISGTAVGHGEVELPGVGVPATGASGGPPVHSVDVNDKQSMRDALNAVRNAK